MTANPAATSTAQPSLSEAMRTGSRRQHEAAEGSGFVSALIGGRLPAAAYGDYLLRLVGVYRTLEDVGRTLADTPAGRAVVDPALERHDRICADLDYWVGTDWTPADSPAADAYVAAVREAEADPLRLIAHHYTRYLGDLAGGQVIGRAVVRQHNVPDGVGVAFYDFPDIPKVKLFRDAYRARLDALELSQDEQDRIVDEVRRAFALNAGLFAELGTKYGVD